MTTVTVVVPLKIRQWGGRKAIIAPDGAPLTPDQTRNGATPTRGDPTLVKALARAHRWRRMLEAGEHGTVQELAKAGKVNETYISRALRLTLLAPEMVEAILDGRQPEGMTPPRLMEGVTMEWARLRCRNPVVAIFRPIPCAAECKSPPVVEGRCPDAERGFAIFPKWGVSCGSQGLRAGLGIVD